MVEAIDALLAALAGLPLAALAGLPLGALAAAVAVFAGRFLAVRTRPEAVTGEQVLDRLRSTVHAIPGTFAALGSLPVVLATEIGFVVAFGVLLDTFVVRSVLVGALNLDVGRWLWWPSGRSRRPGRRPGRRRGRPDGGAHHLTTTGAMVIVTAQA